MKGSVPSEASTPAGSNARKSHLWQRHTSAEFVRFLDEAVVGRRRKQIHLILENLSVHKTAAVRAWLERHPQVQFHFTPTYSSWLNQVEIWLGMITRDCIRHGIFRSVPDLVTQILGYVRLYNRNAQPFRWTYRNPKRRIHVSPISVTQHEPCFPRLQPLKTTICWGALTSCYIGWQRPNENRDWHWSKRRVILGTCSCVHELSNGCAITNSRSISSARQSKNRRNLLTLTTVPEFHIICWDAMPRRAKASPEPSNLPRNLRGCSSFLPLHWPNEGANKESEHYLRRAIQLDPGSFRFHFHLAEILLIEDERSQARAAFRKAIELKPDFGPTHYQLGKLLAREGNNPLALEELEEAVREEPDLVQAYYQLSQVCARLGEVEKSKQMPVNFNRLKKEGAEGTQEFTGVVRKELEMP